MRNFHTYAIDLSVSSVTDDTQANYTKKCMYMSLFFLILLVTSCEQDAELGKKFRVLEFRESFAEDSETWKITEDSIYYTSAEIFDIDIRGICYDDASDPCFLPNYDYTFPTVAFARTEAARDLTILIQYKEFD